MSQLSISIENLHFDYNEKTTVFEEHSLELAVDSTQKNKLFGIIGPSGTGKTTLLSILGGQLNPTTGVVKVNDTEIYKVDDSVRRQLIALQMQTATSLRGKLRYNLVFGLPFSDEPVYTDEELVKVLQQVGLWSLFEPKEGLETLIGEGGLNLSGGQRQRLNFAGLYLRAKYFKPSLILIDEPTSSLDEISEQAITNMIDELATMSLTLVVAHRLKTLDTAAGILDISLASEQKDLKFLNRSDLIQFSKYYRDLRSGKATLED